MAFCIVSGMLRTVGSTTAKILNSRGCFVPANDRREPTTPAVFGLRLIRHPLLEKGGEVLRNTSRVQNVIVL
jgi:hypothetical protein